MAARFQTLFTLPAELYTHGSPLIIAAGALQKDTQTEKVVAQLRLRNLSLLTVKAVKVLISPQDTVGRQLGEAVPFHYLDQAVNRGEDFGSRIPIPLPDPAARSFTVQILEVIFANNSLWVQPEAAVWAPLPKPLTIEAALGDAELVKQLRLEKGADCRFLPVEIGDLWRCSCGEPVRTEAACPKCGRSFFTPDIPALTAAKNARLIKEQALRERAAAEARQAAEAKAAKAKKARKAGLLAGIGLLAGLLILSFLLLGLPAISVSQGNKAVAAGDYVSALEKYRSASEKRLFEKLFHPGEKADAILPAAHYQEGNAAFAEERYLDAVTAFEAAGSYQDSGDRVVASWYQEGEKAVSEGRYADAYAAFTASGARPEDTTVWNNCCLGALQADLAAGNLETADELLKEAGKGPEKDRMYLCLAQAYLEAGRYQDATTTLALIPRVNLDLQEEVKEVRYRASLGLFETEDYVKAEAGFSRLGDYQDAKRYTQLCVIEQTRKMASENKTELLLPYSKKVDVSCLRPEEKESFLADLYAWAKKNEALKTEQGYMDAFVLYKKSGQGDYLARMAVCNEKYLDTPRAVRAFAWTRCDMGSAGKLKPAMEWFCKYGQLSLTIHFTVNMDMNWYLYRTNNGGGARYKQGTVVKGSSTLTVTIPYSSLNGYNEVEIDLEAKSSNICLGYISVYTSNFLSQDMDLYDRFGGERP